ncbi:Uncharacterised protein [Candidatus Norongarragalina meridionalis]|nr:Uncharacterised protein [Candidatus Norongarragalina meridionalis]
MPVSRYEGAHRVISFKRPLELNHLAARLREVFPGISLKPVEVTDPRMFITHSSKKGDFVASMDWNEFHDGTHLIAYYPAGTSDKILIVQDSRIIIKKNFYLENRAKIDAMLKKLRFKTVQ